MRPIVVVLSVVAVLHVIPLCGHAAEPEEFRRFVKLLPGGICEDEGQFGLAGDQPVHLFGQAVALEGGTLVVGAPSGFAGSVCIYEGGGGASGAWGPAAFLVGAGGDRFGASVGLSGATLVVGAWDAGDLGPNTGKAYLFERDGGGPGGWGEVAQLYPSDPFDFGRFGAAVAIDGDTVVVGAPENDPPGCNPDDCGAAYIFEREVGWGEVAQLIQPDPTEFDRFGDAVAIDGDTVVVGAQLALFGGAAYVFERDAGGPGAWGLTATLLGPGLAPSDRFGFSTAIDGDTVIVGAYRADCPDGVGEDCGAAWVFERDAGGAGAWGAVAKLMSSEPLPDAQFGSSVAVDGDRVAVGEWREARDEPGTAYVFGRTGASHGGWRELAQLAPDGLTEEDRFGVSVAVEGDTIIVGADKDREFIPEHGAVYVFREVGSGWR